MKKTSKTLLTLALAVVLVLSLASSAFAADATVTYNGLDDPSFTFAPGSEYTETDLFDNFKDLMPGDTRTQKVTFKNAATDSDYVVLYLTAGVDDITYSETYENTDGKDQANVDGERDETVATMQDFLSQLTLTVTDGEGKELYNGPASGAFNAELGQVNSGESIDLTVTLTAPAELGNDYANRVGEIDWKFKVHAFNLTQLTVTKVWSDGYDAHTDDAVTVTLLENGEATDTTAVLSAENEWVYTFDGLSADSTWSVVEEAVEGYETTYETEGNKVVITNIGGEEPEGEPLNLTVRKEWSGDKASTRPSRVNVTLYDGDEEVETVILSARNDWEFQWNDEERYGDWHVEETSVPKGYTASYTMDDGIVTILNTQKLAPTGQLTWPVYVLGGAGLVLIALGVILTKKKKKSNA